ncbi:amyloid beta precursor protein binding family B member 2 isoform X2 [Brachyhypopomus gauderio]|uniref:amyloid beta precursor protein binding family B member 2 isoform X2 n=1 Tax=Brachyhypopomus gauderio TaxID=698409 RepID=UPI004042430E
MPLHKPPLRRSASTLESTNRNSPSVTPPTSLNLRLSHNQQLGCNVIKEGVVAASTESQASGVPIKSRSKYSLTNLQSAPGLEENSMFLNRSHTPARSKLAPTKSASSSSLYSSSCVSLSFSPSNPKLAKNGTNLQLKETHLDLTKKDKNRNDVLSKNHWPGCFDKDNEKGAPFRRRTKSFLEYHREEDEEFSSSPGKEPAEQEGLITTLVHQAWAKENRVEAHLTLPQNHLLLLPGEEEERSSTQPQLGRVKDGGCAVGDSPASPRLQVLASPGVGLRQGQRGDTQGPAETPPQEEKQVQEEEEEEEDSSWTTLSQESPSIDTPQETGTWGDSVLPPGCSHVCFWNIPSEATQQDPVTLDNHCTSEPNQHLERAKDLPSLTERPNSIVSDSSVEPVPLSAASSSSSSPCYDVTGSACSFLNNNYLSVKEAPTRSDSGEIKPGEQRERERVPCMPYSYVNLRAKVWSPPANSSISIHDLDKQVFRVHSLGWTEVFEADLVSSRSSTVLSECIRLLRRPDTPSSTTTLRRRERERESMHGREEGKAMLLVLQNATLTLIDPIDHTLFHSQPISSIRVWGVGRDHSRDFAYVAEDKNTRVLKCHVFQCESAAEAVTNSLQQICSKIMAERKSGKAAVGGASLPSSDVPLQDFPTPKTEVEHSFHVLYLGTTSVSRPIGMDVINGAVDTLLSSTGKEDWTAALLSVQDANISVIKEKEGEEEALVDCRVRFLSFMGVGRDVHTFAFIMDTGNQHFQCHVFWCEPNAGSVSEAVQSACMLRYQKCLVSRSPSQKAGSSSPPPSDSVTRRVTTSVKRGVQSIIDTLKKKPAPELPHQ